MVHAVSRLTVVCLLLCVPFASDAQVVDVTFDSHETALISTFGPWPVETPADPGNRFSGMLWAELLGQQLFEDTLFSRTNEISCATCHQASAGMADNRKLAVGMGTQVRNTQGLLDVGLQRWFGWDGGTDSLWASAIRPMLTEVEMGGDIPTIAMRLRQHDALLATFEAAGVDVDIGDDKQLVVYAAKAIGAYMRTLVSKPTEFDRFQQALVSDVTDTKHVYSPSAMRGLKLFIGDANCILCHSGPRFSNGEFHDTGRPFFTAVGQVDPGRYTGIQRMRSDPFNLLGDYADRHGPAYEQGSRMSRTVNLGQVNWGQWRTPTLRNLRTTGPYMHDGSLATLREVVDSYADIDPERLHSKGESILKPLALSESDREDLVAFLQSLSP